MFKFPRDIIFQHKFQTAPENSVLCGCASVAGFKFQRMWSSSLWPLSLHFLASTASLSHFHRLAQVCQLAMPPRRRRRPRDQVGRGGRRGRSRDHMGPGGKNTKQDAVRRGTAEAGKGRKRMRRRGGEETPKTARLQVRREPDGGRVQERGG